MYLTIEKLQAEIVARFDEVLKAETRNDLMELLGVTMCDYSHLQTAVDRIRAITEAVQMRITLLDNAETGERAAAEVDA